VLKAGAISVEDVIDNSPTWTPIPDVEYTYVDVGKGG
jgi:hypothetical protein